MVRAKPMKLPAGWLGIEEARFLARHAKNRQHIIEVGSWLGRSTKVLARATKGTVWAVDHWLGTPDDPTQNNLYATGLQTNPYATFCANLAKEIAAKKVVPLKMSSEQGARELTKQYGWVFFDMVYIDADHSYRACLADIQNYLPLLKYGGFLCGHDYHWPGVKAAVQMAFSSLSPRQVTLGPKSMWSVTV